MDPEARTINVISDGFKQHLNYARAWITEDLKYFAKQGFMFEAETGNFSVKAINMDITTTGNTTFAGQGNTGFTSQGDMKIDSNSNMTISCAGNLTIKASRVDFIQG